MILSEALPPLLQEMVGKSPENPSPLRVIGEITDITNVWFIQEVTFIGEVYVIASPTNVSNISLKTCIVDQDDIALLLDGKKLIELKLFITMYEQSSSLKYCYSKAYESRDFLAQNSA